MQEGSLIEASEQFRLRRTLAELRRAHECQPPETLLKLLSEASEDMIDFEQTPHAPKGYWICPEQPQHRVRGCLLYDSDYFLRAVSPNQSVDKVSGRNLMRYLQSFPVVGAQLLDYLLKHQDRIRLSWKLKTCGATTFFCFWGSIYSDQSGVQYVRCLYWHEETGSWRTHIDAVDNVFRCNSPAVIVVL